MIEEEKDFDFNAPMRQLLDKMIEHMSDYTGYMDDDDLGNIENPHWIVE